MIKKIFKKNKTIKLQQQKQDNLPKQETGPSVTVFSTFGNGGLSLIQRYVTPDEQFNPFRDNDRVNGIRFFQNKNAKIALACGDTGDWQGIYNKFASLDYSTFYSQCLLSSQVAVICYSSKSTSQGDKQEIEKLINNIIKNKIDSKENKPNSGFFSIKLVEISDDCNDEELKKHDKDFNDIIEKNNKKADDKYLIEKITINIKGANKNDISKVFASSEKKIEIVKGNENNNIIEDNQENKENVKSEVVDNKIFNQSQLKINETNELNEENGKELINQELKEINLNNKNEQTTQTKEPKNKQGISGEGADKNITGQNESAIKKIRERIKQLEKERERITTFLFLALFCPPLLLFLFAISVIEYEKKTNKINGLNKIINDISNASEKNCGALNTTINANKDNRWFGLESGLFSRTKKMLEEICKSENKQNKIF